MIVIVALMLVTLGWGFVGALLALHDMLSAPLPPPFDVFNGLPVWPMILLLLLMVGARLWKAINALRRIDDQRGSAQRVLQVAKVTEER
jgi:hypothetical protein